MWSSKGFVLSLALAASASGALDCRACHREIVDSFAATAHANASKRASTESILGPFEGSKSRMFTRLPGVYFRMEGRNGAFYQTGIQGGRSRTERFDLVIGSGRRGQTYLYWRDGLLFQLPVSYHAGSKRWINSPGYEDGTVHFERGIPPRCLDCHAAKFELARTSSGPRYRDDYSLGIGCAKCHGETEDHKRIVRPSIETCARCHSGLEHEKPPEPDVHGNQVGLLRSSKCFQKSGSMTCATCHDVHRMQRDAASFAPKCAACHAEGSCKRSASGDCVSCHMPVQQSKLIEVQTYRTHKIGIYKKR